MIGNYTHRLTFLALAALQYTSLNAASEEALYKARATGQFLTGSYRQLGGFADAILPLWQSPAQLLFVDGTFLLGRNQNKTFSAGLGYRTMTQWGNREGIAGLYSFVDSFSTTQDNNFIQFNPGVEWLNVDYEARLQGYIPVSGRTKSYGAATASNLPQAVFNDSGRNPSGMFGAQGHRVFDTNIALVEQVGSGIELEIGKSFSLDGLRLNAANNARSWIRVGGYQYSMNQVRDVYGIQVNLETPINHLMSLLIQNNYDNQNHNRFAVGVRASFGGGDAPHNTLQKRMTDPIIRHQARQSYGQAAPVRLNYYAYNEFNLISNAWFFSPDGSSPKGLNTTNMDCTAENPCSTINSTTALRIQELDPQANLLFSTGSYNIPTDAGQRIANLWNGQRILGRNSGWFTPATGASRPVIDGGVYWGDRSNSERVNSTGYIENMVVRNENQIVNASVNSYGVDAAIAVGSIGGLTIENTDTQAINQTLGAVNALAYGIGSGGNTTVKGGTHSGQASSINGSAIARGIRISGAAQVSNASTSAIAISTGFGAANARGGFYDGGNVTVNGGIHSVHSTSTSGVADAYGIYAAQNASLIGGVYSVRSASSNGAANAYGIYTPKDVVVESTQINTAVSDGQNLIQAVGIGADNATVSNADISAEAKSSSSLVSSVGIEVGRMAIVNNSKINVISSSTGGNLILGLPLGYSSASGIRSAENLEVSNTYIQVNATADYDTGFSSAYGIRASNNATLNNVDLNVISTGNNLGPLIGTTFTNAGVFTGNNATIIDSNVSIFTSSNFLNPFLGFNIADANAVRTVNNATISGGTYRASSNSNGGNANANAINAAQDALVTNATTSGVATTVDGGTADAKGINANNVTVKGGAHSAQASSENGNAYAHGIIANNDALVANVNSSATSTSTGTGNDFAEGVSAGNNATVSDSIVIATANRNTGTASAIGVKGGSSINDTVTSTTITVNGNGINTKCTDVENSDGSCS